MDTMELLITFAVMTIIFTLSFIYYDKKNKTDENAKIGLKWSLLLAVFLSFGVCVWFNETENRTAEVQFMFYTPSR